MKVLFLAPLHPAPPRRGFQARAWHQLRILGARHRVTLLAYAGAPPPRDAADEVRSWCERVVTVPFRPFAAAPALARALAAGRPLQVAVHEQPAMRAALRCLVEAGGFDLLHVQLARMAGVAAAPRPLPGVLDLVDALSVNMARRAALDRGPARWAAALESCRMAAFEREACRSWERSCVATAEDREALGAHETLAVNANGVDLAAFAFSTAPRAPGSIVFTGNLGYFPNREAVRWFVERVLPLVRRERPEATFAAVGARPGGAVRALATRDGAVRVLADVADLRPHLAGATVAVAPLLAGSGHPLKVLEAMACGTPVVASPLAAAGIGAEPGRHLLVAADAPEFAQAVLRLLADAPLARGLAVEARRLVEGRHGWDSSVAGLERIWEAAAARGAR